MGLHPKFLKDQLRPPPLLGRQFKAGKWPFPVQVWPFHGLVSPSFCGLEHSAKIDLKGANLTAHFTQIKLGNIARGIKKQQA